jgi:hydrogenase maturation protease
MNRNRLRCLVLACGNTLRSDDGAGPWLARRAEEKFRSETGLRVIVSLQWTPELAEEIAQAESVLFIDCSLASQPGAVMLFPVDAAPGSQGLNTHRLSAPELLALGRDLYGVIPQNALLLTIGAGSIELGEKFSDEVKAALPAACELIEKTIGRLMGLNGTDE